MYILDVNRTDRAWTPEQAWLLIKSLAANPSIRYNDLLLSDIYKSSFSRNTTNNNTTTSTGESTLQALEQAELITITSSTNGRPSSIKPGRPIFAAAFERLIEDRVLTARMDLAILSQLVKIETQAIEKCEAELNLLAQLHGSGSGTGGGRASLVVAELRPRVDWLLKKMGKAQMVVERYERESDLLKAVLKEEF